MHHCLKYPRIRKPLPQITQSDVKEYFDYDPITGFLTWKKKIAIKTVVGSRAGSKVKNRDSRIVQFMGNVILEHRLIWLWWYGYYPPKHLHIDHINHIEDDNRLSNLRLVTQCENNKNNSLRCDNQLGITGIYEVKLKSGKSSYIGEIRNKGKKYSKQSRDLNKVIEWRKTMEQQLGFHPNHGITKP